MREGEAFAQRVVRWQRRHGRHGLLWQGTKDPYRVWLSEIMLQQTQVSTVLAYYARFLQRFPNLDALASAPLDDVLALWSGLGYYSRARNLHRCAQVLQQQRGGRFPTDSRSLAELPGIGRSTAAAIAAFCFGERVAILDGNVKRVLSRALGYAEDLTKPANEAALWQIAQSLLPHKDIESYTQGLMDLGATVCSTRQPACHACPLNPGCVAKAEDRVQRYPLKTRRLLRGRRAHALLWLAQGSRLWLVQRPPKGVWAGLWSLPEFASLADLQAMLADWPGSGEVLPAIDHALTHFDWHLQLCRWILPTRLGAARVQALTGQWATGRWVEHALALQMGVPAPLRKLLTS